MGIQQTIQNRMKPISLDSLPPRPLVSVLIANYNYANYLGKAIESVQAQTYQNFEIVVCDDGSHDNSIALAHSYASQDSRILIIAKENGGVATALNTAFEAANGQIISLLDADDVWYSDKLEHIVQAFQDSNVGTVMHPLAVVNQHGNVLKDRHPAKMSEGWLGPSFISGLPLTFAPASGLSFHFSVAKEIFPVPPHFRTRVDRILWERAAMLAPVKQIPDTLGEYLLHTSNVTGFNNIVTLPHIDSFLESLHEILQARADFLAAKQGICMPPESWWDTEAGRYRLARALLQKERLHWSTIVEWSAGIRPWLWVLLFRFLPQRWSIHVLKWWWGEGVAKRWIRKIAALTGI
jgi:glycosyltransferase involved in cell wall biosynthesis